METYKPIVNILGIDIEDWYHVLRSIDVWRSCEDRVVQNTNKVLAILKEEGAQATFFVLGHVAEKFPGLVEKIEGDGHEIGSHGYAHIPITQQNPLEFEQDLLKSIRILEKTTGDKIWGYRAPWFSIVKRTSWVIAILKKSGLRYDSSIFPCKTPFYGVPDAPRFPYNISSLNIKEDDPKEKFLEFPCSVYRIPGTKINIPIAGGFYLRFLPHVFVSHAIKKINKMGHPAICYLHPSELDPEQPKVASLKWYHYYHLSITEKKFRRLLREFKFTSTRGWIEHERGRSC